MEANRPLVWELWLIIADTELDYRLSIQQITKEMMPISHSHTFHPCSLLGSQYFYLVGAIPWLAVRWVRDLLTESATLSSLILLDHSGEDYEGRHDQDYETVIWFSRWEHLIYQLGGHGEIIAYVIKGGRVVVEGGRLRGHTTWNEPFQDSPQIIGLYALGFRFKFDIAFSRC